MILSDEKAFAEIEKGIQPNKEAAIRELQKKYIQLGAEREKLQVGFKNCYMDRYSGDLDEGLFLELKADYTKKIKSVQRSLEELEEKLEHREESDSSEERARELIKKHTSFMELTHEMVYDFIDYVEVGEKNEQKEQEVIVHWKF